MSKSIQKGFFFGKTALITGGSSGIGLATARLLAGQGASVWIVARDKGRLATACEEIKKSRVDPSQRVGSSVADISVESQARAAIEEATQALGLPDLVINNAADTHPGYFQDQGLDIFRRLMDVNYFGTLHVTRAVVPGMIQRGTGHIVNVSSLVAVLSMFGYTAYGASKWAVRGFTDILRYEMKPHGITVHLVMPPDTDTPQLASEEPLKPFETKVIVGNGKVMSPEKVAGDILDGVRKNRYLIITGVQAVLIYWLTNLLGPLQYPVMDLLVADAVKKRKQAEEAAAKRV